MPIVDTRRYVKVAEFRAAEEAEYTVKGYASTFDRYPLWDDMYERIERTAFDETDMTDVIMQYDHDGRVFARNKNGSLRLGVDDHGLWIEADLSKTDGSRKLWEDINAGLITEMSFAFTIAEEHFERDTRTRVIDKIAKIYDVSAVSIPQNPYTQISARAFYDGVIEKENAERVAAEEREKKINLLKLLLEV